jgi:hypothetical protein
LTKTEIGEIIAYNDQNKDWQVIYQDDTVIDIDADTLEHLLLDHNNESMNDNIQKKISKAIHEAAYLSNHEQQEISKGMWQVQNLPEKDLIMKAKFEVGIAEQYLFIAMDKSRKTVAHIVGYVDDLTVADT